MILCPKCFSPVPLHRDHNLYDFMRARRNRLLHHHHHSAPCVFSSPVVGGCGGRLPTPSTGPLPRLHMDISGVLGRVWRAAHLLYILPLRCVSSSFMFRQVVHRRPGRSRSIGFSRSFPPTQPKISILSFDYFAEKEIARFLRFLVGCFQI